VYRDIIEQASNDSGDPKAIKAFKVVDNIWALMSREEQLIIIRFIAEDKRNEIVKLLIKKYGVFYAKKNLSQNQNKYFKYIKILSIVILLGGGFVLVNGFLYNSSKPASQEILKK
jgi:hypothetical protein